MSDFLNIESVMGNYKSIQLENARDELNNSLDTFAIAYSVYNNKNPQDDGQKNADSQRIQNIKTSLDQLKLGSDIEFDANNKNTNSNNSSAQTTNEGLLERIVYELEHYGVNFIKSTDITISRMEQLKNREQNLDDFLENKIPRIRRIRDIVQKLVSNGTNMLKTMREVEKNGFQHFFKKWNTKKNEGLNTPPRTPPHKKQKTEKETPKKAKIDIMKQIYAKRSQVNPKYKHGLYLLESNMSIFDQKLEKDVMRRWQDYMKSKEEISRVYKIGITSKGVENRYPKNPTLNILPPILAGWHCVLFFGVNEEHYSVIEKLENYIVDTHGLLGRGHGHGQTEMIFNVSREEIKNICETTAKDWNTNDYEIFTDTILVQTNQKAFFEEGVQAISALLGLNGNNAGSSHRNLNADLKLKNVDSELKLETLKF